MGKVSGINFKGAEYIVTHRNVDIDAIVSAIIYSFTKCGGKAEIVTESNLDKIPEGSKIAILDMQINTELAEKIRAKNLEVIDHYDHHAGAHLKYPSTAAILAKKLEISEWMQMLVELANFCDTGRQLRLEDAAKLFHISGFINALRAAGFDDTYITDFIVLILTQYRKMLEQIIEARELARKVPMYEVSKYKVAIVEKPSTHVNKALFDLGVDLIIYKEGFNLGVTRNTAVTEPNLNKVKPIVETVLREKGGENEMSEWFLHPTGFIACRGSRKHPAKTESVLTPRELLIAIEEICRRGN